MASRRILHAADIHLDSPLRQLQRYEGAPVERIRSASRHALTNLASLAIEQAVDLVVIAGDLYDGDWSDPNTGLFFVQQASRIVQAKIPLLIIRGNHDAANVMTQSLPLPKNPDGSDIMLTSDAVDDRRLESIGVAVRGRSFRNRAEQENLSVQYPTPLSGMFNLGLLHTSLTGAEGHDNYAPCTPMELTDKGYDYWALGHVHKRGDYQIEGGAPIVFSGNLQGRHVKETGAKGCMLLEIDANHRCEYKFQPLDVVRWESCFIDASGMDHEDHVVDEFAHWLSHQLASQEGRLLVARVCVHGSTALHGNLFRRQAQIEAACRAVSLSLAGDSSWLESLRVQTQPPEQLLDPQHLDGPLRSVLAVAQGWTSPGVAKPMLTAELQSLIKRLPPELSQSEPPIDLESADWTTELLRAASAELIGRLSGSEGAA